MYRLKPLRRRLHSAMYSYFELSKASCLISYEGCFNLKEEELAPKRLARRLERSLSLMLVGVASNDSLWLNPVDESIFNIVMNSITSKFKFLTSRIQSID